MELYEMKIGESIKEYAFRILKTNIINLNLKPGEMMESESCLSKKLGISRTPLREVIAMLKNEYLIEVKPQVGMFTTFINWNLILEINFFRNILDREVLKEAMNNITDNVLYELEKNLHNQYYLINLNVDNVNEEFMKLDYEFHRLLCIAANKKYMWEIYSKINCNYDRLINLTNDCYDKYKNYKEHLRYVEIIKNKNIEDIDSIVDEHIEDNFNIINNKIKNNDEIIKYIENYNF